MQKNIIIALDGPAASGKGTLGRALAHKLNLFYFDTGLLYRSVGWRVIETGKDLDNEEHILEATDWLIQNFCFEILNNPHLKSDEAGVGASKSGKVAAMREKLVKLQQDVAADPNKYSKDLSVNGALLDGRDIGTVICPNADVKLFITADVKKRALRRVKELQSLGKPVTYDAVLADMEARDARDASRKAAPMVPAEDAELLDTSDLGPDIVLEKALEIIQKKTSN